MPEKKKMAPRIAYTAIIRMLWLPVEPLAKRTAARMRPTTPIKDNIMPRTRFSILFFTGSYANQVPRVTTKSVLNVLRITDHLRKWQGWTASHPCRSPPERATWRIPNARRMTSIMIFYLAALFSKMATESGFTRKGQWPVFS
jgi:hypothetical protein